MSIDIHKKTDKGDRPLKRSDVESLLIEVGGPEKLDLSGRNLRGIDLSNVDLTRVTLREANLTKANLSNATLRDANLKGIYLRGAYLEGADLSEANLSDAHLENADLRGAYLSKTILKGTYLEGTNLSGIDLSGINLSRFLLSGANLSRANLNQADLSDADLHGADLFETNLSQANLSKANLSKASLMRADLREADLRGANFSGADLSGILISRGSEKDILRGMNIRSSYETGVPGDTGEKAELRIRIHEDPLSAQNLISIALAFTELFTKFWLVQEARFLDLVEYALTHDVRFTKEANVVITDITHNSPFDFKFDVNLNPETAAKAAQVLFNMKKLEVERKEEARLKNQAIEEDIERKRLELQAMLADKAVDRQIKVEEASLKSQEAYIKLQIDLVNLEERKTKLRRETAEFELDFINRALDTAKKLVDLLCPGADIDQKAISARIFLNDLLRVNAVEQIEIIVPPLTAGKD